LIFPVFGSAFGVVESWRAHLKTCAGRVQFSFDQFPLE